jgi:hypothetical protein
LHKLDQVSPTARQLGPGLGLTGPPPTRLVLLMSQIEAWPLVFWKQDVGTAVGSDGVPARSGIGLTGPPPVNVFPSISQTETWPVFLF